MGANLNCSKSDCCPGFCKSAPKKSSQSAFYCCGDGKGSIDLTSRTNILTTDLSSRETQIDGFKWWKSELDNFSDFSYAHPESGRFESEKSTILIDGSLPSEYSGGDENLRDATVVGPGILFLPEWHESGGLFVYSGKEDVWYEIDLV